MEHLILLLQLIFLLIMQLNGKLAKSSKHQCPKMLPKMRKRGIFQEKQHKSRKQDKTGKAGKYEKQESSEKKEIQKKEEKEGKPKQSKARKVCPLMGGLFSQVTKQSNFLNNSTLIL